MNVSSSKHLAETLQIFESDINLKTTIMPLVTKQLLRAMQLAVYFCTGINDTENFYRHYALSVPL